jgi:hypothetical protein|tara:strand:+ start:434 stop:643 length:210 start_codon:yes stop_codon:yes gene_type:complete
MNRKLAKIKVDTLGSLITLTILVNISLNLVNGVPVEMIRDSFCRLSGSLFIARVSDISERRLENIHGNK